MSSTIRQWLPFLNFWQGPRTLLADLNAGVTVGLVLVPQSMAYAALAGMPPITGLYAGSFACMAGGLFGRCAQLQTGPVAMTSLIAFAAVVPLATQDSSTYLALMAILALMVGVMRIILGLLRGAVIVNFISKPVLTGFGTAAGIIIASTQIPKWTQVNPGYHNPVFNAVGSLIELSATHWPSLIMGLSSLAVMIVMKKVAPRWPGILIGLICAGVASYLLNFEALGGGVIGDLPSGLPPLALPTEAWHMAPELISGAFLVVIIGLLEVMTVTSTTERKLKVRTDLNGELIGQGASSLVAGVTSGFPVSGSLSRSSLSLLVGARTGLSSVISGLIVLFTLLFLTPLLYSLPLAALSSAIVMAVVALVRPGELIQAWSVRRSDAIFGIVTCIATLLAAPDMVIGIEIGITLSVGFLLWKMMRPRCVIVVPGPCDVPIAADHQEDPVRYLTEKRIDVRIDGRVNFLNASLLGERIKKIASPLPAGSTIALQAQAINDIDVSGVSMLSELITSLAEHDVTLIIEKLKRIPREAMFKDPRLAAAIVQGPSPDTHSDLPPATE